MPTPEQDPAEDPAEDLAARVRRLEDLHDIGQLRAHYCQALDDGRWDDLVDLFTPDGALVGLSTARAAAPARAAETGPPPWLSTLSSSSCTLPPDEGPEALRRGAVASWASAGPDAACARIASEAPARSVTRLAPGRG